jgi:hypothetical protein
MQELPGQHLFQYVETTAVGTRSPLATSMPSQGNIRALDYGQGFQDFKG